MANRPFLLFFILTASCLNNLIIPYLIYFKKYGLFKKRERNFVGVNAWGIIMDGILAGIINILILNFIIEIKLPVTTANIIAAFLIGLGFTTCCHIYMSVSKWKIWIMPHPWQWNEAGYWHMISMTIQMSYATYPVVILLTKPQLLYEPFTVASLLLIFIFSLMFGASLRLQNYGVKLGLLEIGNEPW